LPLLVNRKERFKINNSRINFDYQKLYFTLNQYM